MRLEKIELHQVCQHANLVLDIRPGLVGILGPNGSGKTNLVNMIKVSLTGDFSVNPGVKDDNIRWGMPDDDYSAVTATWSHNGQQFVVRRALANTTNSLLLAGATNAIRNVKEINNEIERILGMPQQILNFMFVEQWQMFAFISADSSTRSSLFSHLCGTAALEKVHKLLGDEIRQNRDSFSELFDNRQAIIKRVQERTARIAELREQIGLHRNQLLKKSEAENLLVTRQNYSQYLALNTQIQQINKQRANSQESLSDIEKQLADIEPLVAKNNAAVLAIADKATNAQEQLRRFNENKQITKRIAEIQEELAAKCMPKPPEPSEFAEFEQLKTTAILLRKEIETDTRLLETFAANGIVACPTCATPVSHIQPKLDHVSEHLTKKIKKLTNINTMVQSCENHLVAMSAYDAARAAHIEKTNALKVELATISTGHTAVNVNEADLRKTINEYSELQQTLAGSQKRKTAAVLSLNVRQSEVLRLSEQLTALTNSLTELNVSGDDALIATQKLEAHKEARIQISIAEARLLDLLEANKIDQTEYEQHTAALARNNVIKNWINKLTIPYEISHRDNFPRQAAQLWLEDILEEVNKTLCEFDSPFYVELGKNLSFTAVKPDGRKEAANRLSGGEKMLLAMAFRFAVNSLLSGDIGMMVLDEPTAGVDRTNIGSLVEVLQKVAAYARQNNTQIIVITHDEYLEQAFDQTIRLEKVI
jgi:DNA repair exonuclease SbcCD ATPase subunit